MTNAYTTIAIKIASKSYRNANAAYRAIDIAFERGQLTSLEARKLEAMIG